MGRLFACAMVVGLAVPSASFADGLAAPVQVKIQDEKQDFVEGVLPLDPRKRVTGQAIGGMGVIIRFDNLAIHLGQIQTLLKIDNALVYPQGRVIRQPQPLPKTRSGKARDGIMQTFEHGLVHVTQTVEVVPSKPARPQPGDKRRLDAVLVHYTVDNKDTRPHQVGVRVFMNTLLMNSRRGLFAAPNQPGKILNGVELKGEQVPPYLEILQNADLKNPGFIAHLTYRLQRKWESPNRVVLTRLGAGGDGWNVNALAAGDSAVAFFWDPAEIKPGGKRELAYGYGQGVATPTETGGQIGLTFGGSFEPGKLFTITAQIDDPNPGEALTLELPDGMERIEGKERQPVPLAGEDSPSVVLWKARVVRTGDFRLRIRSSTGVTLTKLISITRPTGK